MRPDLNAFTDEVTKTAALPPIMRNAGAGIQRAAAGVRERVVDRIDPVRRIRRKARMGNFDAAESLARDLHEQGRLPVRPEGYVVGELGGGAEAIAQHVVGAADAPTTVAVRKAFDPKSAFYSRNVLAEKMQAGRKLRSAWSEPST